MPRTHEIHLQNVVRNKNLTRQFSGGKTGWGPRDDFNRILFGIIPEWKSWGFPTFASAAYLQISKIATKDYYMYELGLYRQLSF